MKLRQAIRHATMTMKQIEVSELNPSDQMLHRILTTIIAGLGSLKARGGLFHEEYRAEYLSMNLESAGDYYDATEDKRLDWIYRVFDRLSQVWNRQAEEYNAWLDSFDEV
tara:strand:- start:664 stop:993 length:330 start_codon:yes stop_codon:yes gene_type:complete